MNYMFTTSFVLFYLEELQKWEDDICAANIELSEEEQARLLEEYEQEIKERDAETSRNSQKNNNSKKHDAKSSNNNKKNNAEKAKSTPTAAAQASKPNSRKSNTGNGNNKGKQNNTNNKNVAKAQAQNTVKKEVDQSSTSDESWEKDFE